MKELYIQYKKLSRYYIIPPSYNSAVSNGELNTLKEIKNILDKTYVRKNSIFHEIYDIAKTYVPIYDIYNMFYNDGNMTNVKNVVAYSFSDKCGTMDALNYYENSGKEFFIIMNWLTDDRSGICPSLILSRYSFLSDEYKKSAQNDNLYLSELGRLHADKCIKNWGLSSDWSSINGLSGFSINHGIKAIPLAKFLCKIINENSGYSNYIVWFNKPYMISAKNKKGGANYYICGAIFSKNGLRRQVIDGEDVVFFDENS